MNQEQQEKQAITVRHDESKINLKELLVCAYTIIQMSSLSILQVSDAFYHGVKIIPSVVCNPDTLLLIAKSVVNQPVSNITQTAILSHSCVLWSILEE